MWVPSQDQFSATPRQMRRAANPTDTPPRGLDGLLEGVASKEANSPPLCLSTTAGGVHCATTTLWYWRRASVVYPDVPVLAVPSRHRPARTAGRNRTNRHQTAPQVTYKHVMALARNRQVGGSNPPSGSRSAALFRSSVAARRLTFVPIHGYPEVHSSGDLRASRLRRPPPGSG